MKHQQRELRWLHLRRLFWPWTVLGLLLSGVAILIIMVMVKRGMQVPVLPLYALLAASGVCSFIQSICFSLQRRKASRHRFLLCPRCNYILDPAADDPQQLKRCPECGRSFTVEQIHVFWQHKGHDTRLRER